MHSVDSKYVIYFMAGGTLPMYLQRIGETSNTHSWVVHKELGLEFTLEDACAWVLTQPESEHAPAMITRAWR
jgi:hypothetical protein